MKTNALNENYCVLGQVIERYEVRKEDVIEFWFEDWQERTILVTEWLERFRAHMKEYEPKCVENWTSNSRLQAVYMNKMPTDEDFIEGVGMDIQCRGHREHGRRTPRYLHIR